MLECHPRQKAANVILSVTIASTYSMLANNIPQNTDQVSIQNWDGSEKLRDGHLFRYKNRTAERTLVGWPSSPCTGVLGEAADKEEHLGQLDRLRGLL